MQTNNPEPVLKFAVVFPPYILDMLLKYYELL